MNHKPRLFKALRVSFSLAAGWLLATNTANAQIKNKEYPKFVTGEVIVLMQPGTPRAQVDALAGQVGATKVTALMGHDAYKLTLPGSANDKDTLDAASKLKVDPKVRAANPNHILIPLQQKVEPNDPRYLSKEQWNLAMMNMPQAWAITKGGPGVNVAVIDTGFMPDHEDLIGQYHPGSQNLADPLINGALPPLNSTIDGNSHGVHVSGIMVAKTNNSLGIAGICWENIKCVAMQVVKTGDAGGLPGDLIFNAMEYLTLHKLDYNIGCVNLSFGGLRLDPTDTSDLMYIGTKDMADAGIVPVAAGGNFFPLPNANFVPAVYPHVFTVGSVGPEGVKAYYSQLGKIDIAAPGGEQFFEGDPRGILSTFPSPNKPDPGYLFKNNYVFEQGTSMASPDACGVLGLLLSIPGVQPEQAVQAMKDSANRAGLSTVPDPAYGYGRVDAYQAMLRLTVDARVLDPNGVNDAGIPSDSSGTRPPVESYQPTVRIRVNQVIPDNVTLTVDGQGTLPDGTVLDTNFIKTHSVGQTDEPNPAYTIVFPIKFTPSANPGSVGDRHTIVVSGTNPASGLTRSDTRIFTIAPKILAGAPVQGSDGTVRNLAMISVPYMETATDSPTGITRDAKELLGADVALYRYVYLGSGTTTSGGYASFGTGNDKNPDYAKLFFAGDATSAEGLNPVADVRPVGAAWFANLPADAANPAKFTVQTFGKEFGDQPIRIPVTEGWNMIGDPYTYALPFNSVLLEDRKGERMPLGDAIAQGKVYGQIYRYNGANGYTAEQLPEANLLPWQGQWIYIAPERRGGVNLANKYALIVQPTNVSVPFRGVKGSKIPTTRANVVATGKPFAPISGPNSWALQLSATAGKVHDTNNFIGMTSAGVNQKQLTRVPKPPTLFSYVTVGVSSTDEPGMLYSQDIQPTGGARTWDVVVATDQVDSDVALSANFVGELPRNYHITLTDKVTGQTLNLRNAKTYHYNSGKASPTRSFLVTARPTTLGRRAIMSGVFINPSRSADGRSVATYEIGYNISQEANVEVAVLSATGRQIAIVGNTRAVGVGDNRAVWNGRDSAGRAVPAGTYMVQIKAVTSEGETTRIAQPLLVSGR